MGTPTTAGEPDKGILRVGGDDIEDDVFIVGTTGQSTWIDDPALGEGADCYPADVDEVVGSTVPDRHRCLAARDALGREQVDRPAVLHRPARLGELSVDEHAGTRLRGKAVGVVPEVRDAS